MEHLGEFSCPDCNMVFRSFGLLEKHKSRFCIGSAIGDPRDLMRGRVEITQPEKLDLRALHPRKTKTPELVHLREQRDKSLRQTESLALNKLTHEFHKLRMSVEECLPRRHTEGMYPGRKCADGDRLKEACERYEQKLAEIRARTTELEGQRKEIEQQMALVGHNGTAHMTEMLHELKEQEERNADVLYRLSTQLDALQGVKDNVANVTSDQLEDRRTQDLPSDLVPSADGPLSIQIRCLHQAYIQSGGSDPEVLANLYDLQAEALTLEQGRAADEHRTRKKRRMKSSLAALDSRIMAVEHENQQLEEKILKLQVDRERRRGRAAGSELHMIQMMQADISKLRKELEKSSDRQTQPLAPEYKSQEHLPMERDILDSGDTLGPAPYDPVSGFVIFYDIILGVDATFRTVHLVTRLYSGGQEIGPATPLPPVHCQPAGALQNPLRRHAGHDALLAFKQPVPRVQPTPSLHLVVEVQVVGGLELCHQEMRGWFKLQLFDNYNQVQSGFWKLPFRSLPVRPSLGPDELNSIPQLGNMEICLRIVNARDGDVQSLAKIDPNKTRHYKYLSMTDHVSPPTKDTGKENER